MTTPFAPRIVLLSSRFRLPDRALFYGRARLYTDRIELFGWGTNGRHETRIPLAQVRVVERVAGREGQVRLVLRDGTSQTLALDGAASWQQAIEARLPWTNGAVDRRAHSTPDLSLSDLVAYATSMS